VNVAALYDVHAMPWALEAVLAEVDADAVVVGGDFLGGPCPDQTVELVRSLGATVIRGNAEDGDPWGSTLPLTAELDGVLYCHATPTSNLPVTTVRTPDEIVAESFAGVTGTVVIGHTHHQFDRRVGRLRLVNPGSVGMAYEGEVAAFWALIEDGEPRFMRTPIDIERAIREIRASGWAGGEEFIAENLLVAVARDEAIDYFEALPR
jgi:putative phosphoesterase